MSAHPSRRHLLGALGLGAITAGCAPRRTPAAAPSTTPVATPTGTLARAASPVGQLAPQVDPTTVRLPLEMAVSVVVEAGWTDRPRHLDGVFVGVRSMQDRLELRAIDETGIVLWTMQRPLGCERTVLTHDATARAVAVIADVSEGAGRPDSASAHDVRTGELLWGPVPIAGPLTGPGLVVDEKDDDAARTVLDPGTGSSVPVEGRVLAEHERRILSVEGRTVRASHPGGGWTWQVPESLEPGALTAGECFGPAPGMLLLRTPETAGAVVRLADGTVAGEGVEQAAWDAAAETLVVTRGRTMRGLDATGRQLWKASTGEDVVLESAGGRLAYAVRRTERTMVVMDAGSGTPVNPYDVDAGSDPLAVPEVFAPSGACAVRVGGRHLVVTTQLGQPPA